MAIFSLKPKIYQGLKSLSVLENVKSGRILVLVENKYLKVYNDNILSYFASSEIEYILLDDRYRFDQDTIKDLVFKIIRFNPDYIINIGSFDLMNYSKLLIYYKNKTYMALEKENKTKVVNILLPSAGGHDLTDYFYMVDSNGKKVNIVVDKSLSPDIIIANPNLVDVYSLYDLQCQSFIGFCNAIGSYTSIYSNEFSSMYADKGIELVDRYILLLQRNTNMKNKIETLQLGGIMAGISNNLSGPPVVLSIALVLKGYFNLDLVQVYAILAPVLMEYNSKNLYLANIYSKLAKKLNFNYDDDILNIHALMEYIKNIARSLDLPSSLKEAGIDYSDIVGNLDEIAEEVLANLNDLETSVSFTLADMRRILINII